VSPGLGHTHTTLNPKTYREKRFANPRLKKSIFITQNVILQTNMICKPYREALCGNRGIFKEKIKTLWQTSLGNSLQFQKTITLSLSPPHPSISSSKAYTIEKPKLNVLQEPSHPFPVRQARLFPKP
jgi:hypothetical protein